MQNSIEEFYQIFEDEKIRMDDIELAEILWLAQQIKQNSYTKKPLLNKYKPLLDLCKLGFFKNKKLVISEPSDKKLLKIKESLPTLSFTNKNKKVEFIPLIATKDDTTKNLPFHIPINRYFHNDTKWIYALRHFKQKKITSHHTIFNEEQTADYIASNRIFNPQFTPHYEKRFEAVFIVELSNSMEIWQELIDEFFKSIRNYAIFKNITIYYVQIDKELSLYKTKTKNNKVKKYWYKQFSSEKVCFIFSDMLSNGWYENNWIKEFNQWQKKMPLCIVQLLPYRLWKATILNYVTLTKFKGVKAFSKNSYLKSKYRVREHESEILKIPILNFENHSFDAYGRVYTAKANNRIDGAIFILDKPVRKKPINKNKILTDEERIDKFYQVASEPAKRLVEYFSVIPLSFPIMKIVQYKLMPNSTQMHLSEVFMSGLIDEEINITDGNEFYHFYKSDKNKEGVREILLNILTTPKAVDTILEISKFISQRDGSFDFLAFLKEPLSIDKNSFVTEMDIEFARISVTLLEKMGGEYIKLANNLIKYVEKAETGTKSIIIVPISKHFIMGSDDGEEKEKPAHKVIINYNFEISQYLVTVREFRAFVKDTNYETDSEKFDGAMIWNGENYTKKKDAYWDNPYFKQNENHPVVCITYNDAMKYIEWLNKKTSKIYRLPTEAEWEFVCRADSTTKWYFGEEEKELNHYGWYNQNSNEKTHPIGDKKPNPWGLYDICGNVWEWCLDDYLDNYNETSRDGRTSNSKGRKEYKTLRGGSWGSDANATYSSYRMSSEPTRCSNLIGFRILRSKPQVKYT